MIPEPQRTYVLELLKALGPVADAFVVAGAQVMKFMLSQARATKDIDFVLNVCTARRKRLNRSGAAETGIHCRSRLAEFPVSEADTRIE